MSLVALALAAQLASSGPPPTPILVAAASASPRPAECAVGSVASRPWSLARRPGLAAYCGLLARGYARLERSPLLALALAEDAERALPRRAAPQVLAGRALAALGRHGDAYARFERARTLQPRSVDEPSALHDYAVSAQKTGHDAAARALYRSLVARAGLIEDASDRQRAYVEAAFSVMNEGASALPEAVGFLSEARRRGGLPGGQDLVIGALALALDRMGRAGEARGVVAEAAGHESLSLALERGDRPGRRPTLPVVREGELLSVVALLAEASDPAAARDAWTAFLASPAGKASPWRAHAEARLGANKSKGR